MQLELVDDWLSKIQKMTMHIWSRNSSLLIAKLFILNIVLTNLNLIIGHFDRLQFREPFSVDVSDLVM